MAGDPAEPFEAFEAWLLHRVAHAVEAGEVPADLLTELQAEFDGARAMPPTEGHTKAVKTIAEILGLTLQQAEEALSTMEAGPPLARERLVRQVAEAWLADQRRAYQRQPDLQ